MPTAAARCADLDADYPLGARQIDSFRQRGFIRLGDVLSAGTLDHYGRAISAMVDRLNDQRKPMAERTTYEKAFLQIMNIWRKDETVKQFSFSRRLARIAAQLMGVAGVRMYHDQALYKEPGGGFTPWHVDQVYWPVDRPTTCTAWIPLQDTPLAMGALSFADGSHRFERGRNMVISDDSEKVMETELTNAGYPVVTEPFALGDVSFHYGYTFHRAGPNTTDTPRRVMTMIYIDAESRLTQPQSQEQRNDHATWCPGVKVGAEIDSPLNPVLYRE